VNKSGAANALLVDTSDTTLSLQEISSGRDALILYGTSGGALISSSTNDFQNVVDGLNLTVVDGTLAPVTVSVKATSSSVVSNAKEFVAAYNSFRKSLDTTTDFNEENLTTGILFGSSVALQADTGLTNIITDRFFGVGEFESLEEVGISLTDKGQMELNEAKLTAAFNKDPESIKQLFTHKTKGVAAKLNAELDRLAGTGSSLLGSRTATLTRVIESNTERIDLMTATLDRQRERLLLQFYHIETTIAKMQDNLKALDSFQLVPPLTSTK
jgi:flagellar hook-associated protein 2